MQQEDTYQTIERKAEGFYKEKGSKFFAFAWPIETADDFKLKQAFINKQYHDARHRCFAYVIGHSGDKYKMSDDGEPSSTAGKPILGQIRSFNLTNVLVYVIRYFGGILLGTGGLIRAYKTAAADALKNASIITQTIHDVYELHFPYSQMGEIMHVIKTGQLVQFDQQFAQSCSLKIKVKQNKSNDFFSLFKNMKAVTINYLYTI